MSSRSLVYKKKDKKLVIFIRDIRKTIDRKMINKNLKLTDYCLIIYGFKVHMNFLTPLDIVHNRCDD